MTVKNLSVKQLFNSSFIAIALAFAGLPLYIYIPDLYVRHYNISLSFIGISLVLIRLLDAFQDPYIGYFSDKYYHKKGLTMIIGSLTLTLGVAGLFYGPPLGVMPSIWFIMTMILVTTGFSIVMINLTTIGSLFHQSSYQRVRLSAWREGSVLIGVLIACAMISYLQKNQTLDDAFIIVFWVFLGLLSIGLYLFYKFLKEQPSPSHRNPKNIKKHSLKSYLTHENKLFFLVYFLSHFASAIPAVIVFFFIRDYLNLETYTSLFLALYFISGALCMKVWISLSKNKNPNTVWLISMMLSIVTFIWALFLTPGDIALYAIICLLSGTALGADVSLPPVILANKISAQKSDINATQDYAFLALSAKIAIALASGITFIILDLINFEADKDNTKETLNFLLILYALIPCLIKAISAHLLWFYYIKKGDVSYEPMERNNHHEPNNVS